MKFDFETVWRDEKAALISAEDYHVDLIEPPQYISKYVTLFFKFHSDQPLICDVQPANTGHMMVFLDGHGEAKFFNGGTFTNQPVSLIGPTNAAMQYVVKGPFTCFGCAFSTLGWKAITGLRANDSCDQFVDSGEIFGPEAELFFATLLDIDNRFTGAEQHRQMAETAGRFFQPLVRDISEQHQQIVTTVISWIDSSLNPDLEELYARLPVKKRQAQRLIGEYFGCAPKQLLRKYRAVRAARILNDPDCTDDQLAIVQNLFYDQSHMTREIHHFAGRTPAKIEGAATSLLRMWLDNENIRGFNKN